MELNKNSERIVIYRENEMICDIGLRMKLYAIQFILTVLDV